MILMVLSQTERAAWRETGTSAVRVAKIKARDLQQAAQAAKGSSQAQQAVKVAGNVAKAAGTVGKVAKVGLPVLGGVLDAGIGLAEGEDPTRAIAGAAGSTAGGAAGAWGGALAGAAIGAPLAPFTFGASSAIGGVIGGVAGAIGGSMLGGWGADRLDQKVRGQQPIDLKRQQQAAAVAVKPGSSGNNPNWGGMGDAQYNQPSTNYPALKGQFKPDPNATYSYQPMRPDGSGGQVYQAGTQPQPQQQQRGQLQPASFNQSGGASDGWQMLPGFERGGKRDAFSESSAASARQSPSPSNNGQLVQAAFVNPASVAAVAGGAAKAAAPAASVAGKLPINPLLEFGKEALKQTALLPVLGGLGLLYGAPKGAARAPIAPADPRYANPQPAAWDQLLFGGAVNRMFGPPQGFEYQKLDVEAATKRREQDTRQNTAMRGQDVQTYKTDVGAQTTRRGQDLNLVGKDLTSGRQLEGNKYRADRMFQGRELRDGQGGSADRTNASKERQVTQTNQTRYGVADLTSGRQLEGKQLQYGKGGQGDRTNASKERQVTQTNQTKLANTGLQNQGKLQVADLNSGRRLEGQVYTADSRLKGTTYTADTRLAGTTYTADRRLQGTAYTADKRLAGTTYTADRGYAGKVDSANINAGARMGAANITGSARIAQEGVRQSGQEKVATIRAGGQVNAATVNAGGRVAAAKVTGESRVRVADITTARSQATSQDELYQKSEAEKERANTARMVASLRSSNDLMASGQRDHASRLKQLGIY